MERVWYFDWLLGKGMVIKKPSLIRPIAIPKLDMPIRWNSTYLILKNAIGYKSAITVFYNSEKGPKGSENFLLVNILFELILNYIMMIYKLVAIIE